jgi:hypothetical protein
MKTTLQIVIVLTILIILPLLLMFSNHSEWVAYIYGVGWLAMLWKYFFYISVGGWVKHRGFYWFKRKEFTTSVSEV